MHISKKNCNFARIFVLRRRAMLMENEELTLVDELKTLVDGLEQMTDEAVMNVKEQVEQLKNQFYRVSNFTEEAEKQFRELLQVYKAKRAEVTKVTEEQMAQNLLRKENILEQMKTMAQAETADVMGNLQKMRDLQTEWKSIGAVPQSKVQTLWKQYQLYQEQFYDLVKINIELRDLDFKKNLELKTLLCEAAEKLKDNPNIVEANRALQQLHEEWAEIGPVARELREDIWNRFKDASSVINKKHQAYFDNLHAKEGENLERKQAIIEKLKAIDFSGFKSNKEWDEASKAIDALQAEWRTIGFAPKKNNQSVYEEYRSLCDAFFKAKTSFYKQIRDTFSENLRLKRELIAKAEELKNSTAWKETSEALINLQQEWKKIGPVARKYSDAVWKEFSDICDSFFNAKREQEKEIRNNARRAKRETRNEKALESNDRNKLVRMYENLTQQIKTAENNILFFSGKSKTASKLVEDMQKKIDTLKKDLDDLEAKINAIDAAD